MKQKFILGTVQLGLPYGINNATGKPSEEEAFAILDLAFRHNVRILDSADAYGDSLDVIRKFQQRSGNKFRVINKFKVDSTPIDRKLAACLDTLEIDSLYSYMYHSYSDYLSRTVAEDLVRLKRENKFEKIGISIYTVEELKAVVDDPAIDIIQLPVNLLDFGLRKSALLELAKKRGKEIHARSVYLQGLFLRDMNLLTGNMTPLRPYLEDLKHIATSFNKTIKEIALNFVLHNELIDYVVLGVDDEKQLLENLALTQSYFSQNIVKAIRTVEVEEVLLLNPANWKP